MATKQSISLSHWGAFVAEVTDGKLTKTSPFADTGSPSPMVSAWPDMVYSKVRIEQPMVRRGYLGKGPDSDRSQRGREPFVPVSWDQALDLAASALQMVKTDHGNEAILGGSYGWSSAGRFHHARTQIRRFLFSFGGCVDQAGNYSWGAAQFILPHVIGNHRSVSEEATSWKSIAENASLLVAFGGLNPKNWQITSGGAGLHRLDELGKDAGKAGVELVAISPTRDDAPDWMQASWLAPRPNTDTALMLGLAHTLIAEGLHNTEFLDRYCVGFEQFWDYLNCKQDGIEKDADWAADITEIDADTIRQLARRMAAKRTMLTASWSLQRGDHGEQPFWALIALAALLGQIGLPGGGFSFGYGSMNGIGAAREEILTPNMESMANPINLAIPVARLADLLLSPGETIDFNGSQLTYPDIRLIYWAGGNPFHHHQALNRLLQGWQRVETVIVHEAWWTPTARLADIVLPATTTLERNDIGGSTRDRYVFAMAKAIEPVGQARNDFDILDDLAARLGCRETFSKGRDEAGWLKWMYRGIVEKAAVQDISMPDFDAFWEQGYWQATDIKDDDVLLGPFRDDPKANPLATPSKKIEIFSETIAGFDYDDCPGHPAWMEPVEWLGDEKAENFPFHLITNQPRSRLHSQMDAGPISQAQKVNGREPVWINPTDAENKGISEGDVVRLFNERGACLAGAVITGDVRPGVVVLATGAWFDPLEMNSPGSLEKHGNPNVLTLDKGTSKLAQGCSALSALIQIEKFDGTPPPISAFDPPHIESQ